LDGGEHILDVIKPGLISEKAMDYLPLRTLSSLLQQGEQVVDYCVLNQDNQRSGGDGHQYKNVSS